MDEREWLAEQFEEHRPRLRAVAYRMLGSLSEADDAVQETWLRLSRSDAGEVENLGGWLTTVVGRVFAEHAPLTAVAARGATGCARAGADRRPRRRHRPRARGSAGRLGRPGAARGPRDAVAGRAARVRTCTTYSRVPFDEIAPISTARRRRRASSPAGPAGGSSAEKTIPDADLDTQREMVDAFLAAAREGDFDALLEVLDPEVVLRADRRPCSRPSCPKWSAAPAAVARQALEYQQPRHRRAAGARQRRARHGRVPGRAAVRGQRASRSKGRKDR